MDKVQISSHPKIYREFAPEAAHQGLNLIEQVSAVFGDKAAPKVLGVLPEDFDSIEFRTVRRQIVQIQPVLCPLVALFVYRDAFVYAGVVNQDDSWNFMRLSRDVVENAITSSRVVGRC